MPGGAQRRLGQSLVGYAAPHQSHLHRGRSADPFAAEQCPRDIGPSGTKREQRRTSSFGHNPQFGERQTQPRRLGHDDQVAVQEHRGTESDGHPVDGCEEWFVEAAQDIEQTGELRPGTSTVICLPVLFEQRTIGAGGEGAADAGEGDSADRIIGQAGFQRDMQLVIVGRGERVQSFRAVDGKRRHTVGVITPQKAGHSPGPPARLVRTSPTRRCNNIGNLSVERMPGENVSSAPGFRS
nr:hypothetical protein [Nocardia carnea]